MLETGRGMSAQGFMVARRVAVLNDILVHEFPHVDRETLAHCCGVAANWWSPAVAINQDDYLRLLRQLQQNDIPNIAIRVSSLTQLQDLGMVGYAMLSSPTLERGIRLMNQVIGRSYPYLNNGLDYSAEHGILYCRVQPAGMPYLQTLQELWLLSMWNYVRDMLPDGVAACASAATLAHAAPAYHWQYQQHLGCKVEFDQERTQLLIPSQWLRISVRRDRNSNNPAFEGQVSRLLNVPSSVVHNHGIVHRVRRALLEQPQDCEYKLEQTAALLAVSGRTLRRQLAQESSSFRDVVLAVRMDLAKDYLLNTQLTVQEIAFQLGYSQPNNFFRSFRRYCDTTPEGFRRQQQNQL